MTTYIFHDPNPALTAYLTFDQNTYDATATLDTADVSQSQIGMGGTEFCYASGVASACPQIHDFGSYGYSSDITLTAGQITGWSVYASWLPGDGTIANCWSQRADINGSNPNDGAGCSNNTLNISAWEFSGSPGFWTCLDCGPAIITPLPTSLALLTAGLCLGIVAMRWADMPPPSHYGRRKFWRRFFNG